MRNIVRLAAGAAAAATLLFVPACDDDDDDDLLGPGVLTYQAFLFGANEVPARAEDGVGVATFIDRGDRIEWTLTLDNITAVNMSHIHGPANPDANAAVIVDLFMPTTPTGELNNRTESDSFTATNSNQAVTMAQLRTHLNSTRAYVNVHTTEFPAGAIRGQIIRIR